MLVQGFIFFRNAEWIFIVSINIPDFYLFFRRSYYFVSSSCSSPIVFVHFNFVYFFPLLSPTLLCLSSMKLKIHTDIGLIFFFQKKNLYSLSGSLDSKL